MAVSVDHYENFPVASWLCPPRLRAPIAAIYHFARTADDIAAAVAYLASADAAFVTGTHIVVDGGMTMC